MNKDIEWAIKNITKEHNLSYPDYGIYHIPCKDKYNSNSNGYIDRGWMHSGVTARNGICSVCGEIVPDYMLFQWRILIGG